MNVHLRVFVFAMLLVTSVFASTSAPANAAPASRWRSTNIAIQGAPCFDPSGVMLARGTVADSATATFALKLGDPAATPTRVSDLAMDICTADGTLFARAADGRVRRFRYGVEGSQPVALLPTHFNTVDAQHLYAFNDSQLWASADGGLTWEARANPYGAQLQSLSVAADDGRVLYGVVADMTLMEAGSTSGTYMVVASSDGGQTWEERTHTTVEKPSYATFAFKLSPVNGYRATHMIRMSVTYIAGHDYTNELLSIDGGRSFTKIGESGFYAVEFDVVNTPRGLLRFQSNSSLPSEIARSTDSGQTWKTLAQLARQGYNPYAFKQPFVVVPSMPNTVLMNANTGLLRSDDAGETWKPFDTSAEGAIAVSPFAEPTVVSYEQNPARVLDLMSPEDRRCFAETGFCMSGRIRQFWEQNGGLAVFGLPIEPQHATSIEGHTYQVQTFERNRLELHPEQTAPYDVQLGRLGADLLEKQGRDWTAFPTSGAQPGCRLFVETNQRVCGDILKLWRANGIELDGKPGKTEAESTVLFGVPLSGLITETLSDGKTYQVQYFERARFELHPENAAPYNVLIGRLGSELDQ